MVSTLRPIKLLLGPQSHDYLWAVILKLPKKKKVYIYGGHLYGIKALQEILLMARDCNGAGQGRARGWDLRPHPAWFLPFPVPALPRGAGKTTLPHPRPLGHRGDLPCP